MSIHVFFVSLRKITKKRKYIMELIYLLYLIIGIALGALAVFFAMRSQVQAARERSTSTEQQMREQQETFRQQMQAMQEAQQQQMRDGRESLQQQLRSQQESQQQQMAQQMALLREQMSTTSERVLKERAAELSAVNSEQLSKILDPLQDDLRQMRSQTEKMQKDHNDSLLQLKAAIQVNMERERAMGEQTERLAQALTGQNKIQGNFGERWSAACSTTRRRRCATSRDAPSRATKADAWCPMPCCISLTGATSSSTARCPSRPS